VDTSDSHSGTDRAGRRRKRFLTPAQKAEIARLSEALKEMGVRLMLVEGNRRWD
jgi:hypothetical protein